MSMFINGLGQSCRSFGSTQGVDCCKVTCFVTGTLSLLAGNLGQLLGMGTCAYALESVGFVELTAASYIMIKECRKDLGRRVRDPNNEVDEDDNDNHNPISEVGEVANDDHNLINEVDEDANDNYSPINDFT